MIPCYASGADMAARLLGVDAVAMATCLVTKTVRVRGEALASNATVKQAQVCKTKSQGGQRSGLVHKTKGTGS
jgi:hypothetical protein